MAQINNPRKVFNFRLELDGVDQFEIQKVTIPEIKIDVVEHGDTNYKVKTGGMISFGDMTLEKLVPMTNVDTNFWDWISTVQDPYVGGGALPDVYMRDIVIKEMDSTGTVTLNKFLCEGCWPHTIKRNDADRMTSDNVLETITLAVTRMKKLK